VRNNTHGITIYGCQGGVIVNNLAYNPYGGNFLAGIALGVTHGKTTSENTVMRNNLVDSQIGLAGSRNAADHNIIVRHPRQYFRDIILASEALLATLILPRLTSYP